MLNSGKKFKTNSLPGERIKRKKNLSSPMMRPIYPEKKASFCILKKGALTVEAALFIPLFVMITVCIISIMGVYSGTLKTMISLREKSEKTAQAASFTGEDIWITIPETLSYRPFYLPKMLEGMNIVCMGRARALTGRDKGADGDSLFDDARYVYVAENGRVYHTSSKCSHICLSIHAVSQGDVGHMRNENGGRYKACEKCVGNGSRAETLYVTDDGDRFHNSLTCSGLKRTVKMVDINEVQGLGECSGCRAQRSR